jgi:hypothetical protein
VDSDSLQSGSLKTHSLDFKFISDDGREVTYRAIVSDPVAAGEPIFALTVITGSPHNLSAQSALQVFLRQLRAAFAIVGPAKTPPIATHEPISFNPKKDLLFIAELITIKANGSFEVQFEVDSTLTSFMQRASHWLRGVVKLYGYRQLDRSIDSGKQHFVPVGGGKMPATVTCSQGKVRVHPGHEGYTKYWETAKNFPPKKVDVRCTKKITIKDGRLTRSYFTIHANFKTSP